MSIFIIFSLTIPFFFASAAVNDEYPLVFTQSNRIVSRLSPNINTHVRFLFTLAQLKKKLFQLEKQKFLSSMFLLKEREREATQLLCDLCRVCSCNTKRELAKDHVFRGNHDRHLLLSSGVFVGLLTLN
jgi:hypothetical protein